MPEDPAAWWREGVLYQVYLRSFMDSNGDGIGDLPGLVERLDHLEWLGVRGIWLSPTMRSPNADWGYDVADYCSVDPVFGTLADLDTLVAQAGRRGIRVLLDLVPNHTSSEHPWFRASRSSRTNPKRDWYVWSDPGPDGGPPNNWVSTFGGPAWTFDAATGQHYLHNFLPQQPDLNWWNPEVRDAFDAILRFWFARGIAGFRIDVAHMIVKDRFLRDNPPATDDDPFLDRVRGQRPVFNSSLPAVHDVHRRWRALADSYDPPRVLVGETFLPRVLDVLPFYGRGDEVNLAFNIPLAGTRFEAVPLRLVIDDTEAHIPDGCVPVWTGSNHDLSRFPTRWAGADPGRARCALMMLLTLRGCVFLYYGDEIGLTDTPVPEERIVDPVGVRFHPYAGRDPARTPMPWSGEAGGGFTRPGVEPWLPFGDLAACNVAAQRHDPGSFLSLTRDLIGLREAMPELRTGVHRSLRAPDGVLAYRRGERTMVALNIGEEPATLGDVCGTVRIATCRARDGESLRGPLALEPGDGVVVWLDAP